MHFLVDWHVRLHKLDRIVVFPSELIMLYRMATLLRGLSLALRYNIGVADHWTGAAKKLLAPA
eukprot:COSAG02_NODE_2801_length_8003_cov_5.731655_3_plen_63_part_00